MLNNTSISSEYYRQNAPSTSVAKEKLRACSTTIGKSPNSTMGSSNGFKHSPTSSPYTTPFYLTTDSTNKYRVDKRVEKSIDFTNMIPFLRTQDDARP